MDFRLEQLRKLSRALAAVTAWAAPWMERARPVWMSVYGLRRRLATMAVIVLAGSLFVHVVFGANGMVIYKRKRVELETLRQQVDRVQSENQRYTEQIQGLKSDQKAIEKEAREQLGYAKPGEVVYVAPAPARPLPAQNHSARK
jgi:cell division protein FtsB